MSVDRRTDPTVVPWIERFLRRRFDLPDGTTITTRFPRTGTRTFVAIVTLDEQRCVVVKLLGSLGTFFRLAYNTRRLHALGLPVPELLAWAVAPRAGAVRSFVTVESYLPAQDFLDLDEDARLLALDGVADVLARLHSIRRRHRGPLLIPQPGDYAIRLLASPLARIDELAPWLPAGAAPKLRAHLLRAAAQATRRDAYELLHGHVFPGNVRVDGRRAGLIDLGSVHFGDFARDLARLLHRLCTTDDQREQALRRYFERVEHVTRDDWERLAPFYVADLHLAEARGAMRGHERGECAPEELRRRIDLMHATLAT